MALKKLVELNPEFITNLVVSNNKMVAEKAKRTRALGSKSISV